MEIATLNEDVRNHPSLQKFVQDGKIDDNNIVKSYFELESKMGSRVEIPKDDATPEQWKEFHAKYGPKDASAYNLKFDDLDSIKATEVLTDNLKGKLKEFGLTPIQAQGILDEFRGLIAGKETAIKTQMTQSDEQVRAAWELAYPGDSSANVKTEVDNFLKAKFGEDVATELKNSGIYKDPEKFKNLLNKARAQTDNGIEGKNDGSNGTGNPKADLEAIRSSFINGTHPVYKKALTQSGNPLQAKAIEEMAKLQASIASYEN